MGQMHGAHVTGSVLVYGAHVAILARVDNRRESIHGTPYSTVETLRKVM